MRRKDQTMHEYALGTMGGSRAMAKSLERSTDMLDRFKSFVADQMQADQLVELLMFGEQFRDAYARFGEVPEYVGAQISNLNREIKAKLAAENEAELRKVNAQLESLRTAEEKREALRKRREELQAKLASA